MNKRLNKILKSIKNENNLIVFKNEPLLRHTTFKVGGKADVLVIPKNIKALKKLIILSKNIPITIIGNGSNVLISDKGIRGIVVKLAKGLDAVEFTGDKVAAGSGVLLSKLLSKCAERGLSGLEFCVGIPATLGGALISNLGSYGMSISDRVSEVTVLKSNGKEYKIKRNKMKFGYRRSKIFNGKGIIIGAVLKLKRSNKSTIKNTIKRNLLKKKNTQPMNMPSAGCVFINPKNKHAGKLIDLAGCKGMRVGRAEVSKKHANYIINMGGASYKDIADLAKKVKKQVKKQFGIMLKNELIDSNHLSMLSL